MHLGDSQLQSESGPSPVGTGCDLHLGDSQLQSKALERSDLERCDLHLGDSQLQWYEERLHGNRL